MAIGRMKGLVDDDDRKFGETRFLQKRVVRLVNSIGPRSFLAALLLL